MQDLINALRIFCSYLNEEDYLYKYPTNCEHDELTNAIRFADTVVNIPSGFRRNVKECW